MGAKKTVRKAGPPKPGKAAGKAATKKAAKKATKTATKKSTRKATKPAGGKATKKPAKPAATGAAGNSTRKAVARRPAAATNDSPGKALAEYQQKRDFSRTAEPSGSETTAHRRPGGDASPLRFVIQKHAASHLHFDFRLELDGVMKSWAVPKGPSMRTGIRRLAMEVEDHPISYNTFEGTIPKGQYGGGTVMLWDRGHYLPADGDPASLRKGLRKGRLDIVMLGERLKGGFTLVRSSRSEGKPQWLLFKRSDEYADPRSDPVDKVVTSVVSGRTMDEIAAGDEVWHSNRK